MRPPHGMPLGAAITAALIVKAIALFMLHEAFFSAPQVKKMRMPTVQVEQHLLSSPPPVSSPLPLPKAQP